MTTKINSELFCLHCEKECSHTITYVGNYLNRIQCNECQTEITLDRKKILETYAADTIERILTKPQRLTEEIRKDLTSFITSLPIRIVTKPYRLVKELLDLKEEKE